jgi:NADH pyrophosphatase NudC (nudix superfamily)
MDAEEMIKQFEECNALGYRWVSCPKCGTENKAEADADTVYCNNCEDLVKIPRLI